MESPVTRRRFLQGASAVPVAGLIAQRTGEAGAPASARDTGSHVYARLGVRPFINAAGTYTALSASLMPAEVVAAMEEASRHHVSIAELQAACGARIASLLGAEAALVTSGCAAALTLATAACIAGDDREKIRRLPETDGMKNEVVFLASHRFAYDHAIRNAGARIVEVETRDDLVRSIGARTAMLFFLNNANDEGAVQREEFARIANEAGVPCLIDAAADVPPVANLRAFTAMGYDLAAFSGGKGIRGPQCSGLLLGRQNLIDAAFLNGSPHSDSVGRIGKVGKEEIVGLTRAIELYLERDHAADWREWERRVEVIGAAVRGIGGARAEAFVPEIANEVPHLAITWDPDRIRLTRNEFAQALRDGEPRIEPRPGQPDVARLEIGVWMMEPGDAEVVARRCAEVLRSAL